MRVGTLAADFKEQCISGQNFSASNCDAESFCGHTLIGTHTIPMVSKFTLGSIVSQIFSPIKSVCASLVVQSRFKVVLMRTGESFCGGNVSIRGEAEE